ncbi:hypothetical protein BDA96_09G048700 [Sorghum bicolor]|uniref:RING-type E3 ubiquitin transferase n=3 Tax=Sorghum bicolor TaxID=4558 RepID=C5Z051_SORBI|nr:E3 ubiquitin-protein ligase SINA-like 2 isoform X2 [Sorghum bicolor]EES19035.1 hypothetical protein SORBI_3009G045700 [Sorghum bicolor]KAG0516985.1 hypothetical protein BDA96_09G048700 [Sorghum bicolor]OQU77413.1 hypothetical protein SORBI_3009G045700 [Sorghum bicolor]|eukprot:XP_002440605.1 E3 ubiquitin-protein ligase SINA-like 2 isoform X2 [Sorghum bicolor]
MRRRPRPLVKRRKKMVSTFSFEEDEDSDSVEEDEDLGAADSLHAPPDVRARTSTAVANVTVGDADALECGVCFLALRPPIFQCEVGHVVCSACRDKLEATGNGNCHVCRAATRGGYRRCYAMERLVDCIRVPCPYAAHGCDATPPYHGQESHRQVCPHAPCHCPGDSCGFIGSETALMDHFAGAHKWPCTTKVRAGEAFSIRLRDGFNFFLLADHDRCGDGEQAAVTCCSVPCRLFLLNVMKERLSRAISVICIHPHTSSAAAANNGDQQLPLTQCELVFSCYGDRSSCRSHYQSSVFRVVCTDLSSGLPNPENCFQFFVPNTVFGVGDDKNSIQIKARIIN